MMLMTSKSHGFLVREVLDSQGDHERLAGDPSVDLWCSNIQAADVAKLETGLQNVSDNPSCSSSCSSRVAFSLSEELQTHFKRKLVEQKPYVVVLAPFKYLHRHKTYRFDRAIALFEMGDGAQTTSNRFSLGPKSREKLVAAGLLANCPIWSMRIDLNAAVCRKDERLWIEYEGPSPSSGPFVDLFEQNPSESPHFTLGLSKTDSEGRREGLWVNLALFAESHEHLEGRDPVRLSPGCRIQTSGYIYELCGNPNK
jgi:hypothetical protein